MPIFLTKVVDLDKLNFEYSLNRLIRVLFFFKFHSQDEVIKLYQTQTQAR